MIAQLDLFADSAPADPELGFTAEELSALRLSRLESAVRAIADEQFIAAWTAVKRWHVEPQESPVFQFLHGKLTYARGLLQAVTA